MDSIYARLCNVAWAYLDHNMGCSSINMVHLHDLYSLLNLIRLVDTDSINPKPFNRQGFRDVLKTFKKMRRKRELGVIADNVLGSWLSPSGVRECLKWRSSFEREHLEAAGEVFRQTLFLRDLQQADVAWLQWRVLQRLELRHDSGNRL